MTYITLKLHHVSGQLQVHRIRQEGVIVNWLLIASVGHHFLGFLGGCHTEHIQGSVIFGLGDFIILLVFSIRLDFGHVHVVNKFGIILQAPEPDLFAFFFLVGFLVLDLETKEKQLYPRGKGKTHFGWVLNTEFQSINAAVHSITS